MPLSQPNDVILLMNILLTKVCFIRVFLKWYYHISKEQIIQN